MQTDKPMLTERKMKELQKWDKSYSGSWPEIGLACNTIERAVKLLDDAICSCEDPLRCKWCLAADSFLADYYAERDIIGPLADRPSCTNCIPRSSLPVLPTVWKKPFHVVVDFDDTYEVQDADGCVIIEGRNEESANICCALLNLAYPAPAEGE